MKAIHKQNKKFKSKTEIIKQNQTEILKEYSEMKWKKSEIESINKKLDKAEEKNLMTSPLI